MQDYFVRGYLKGRLYEVIFFGLLIAACVLLVKWGTRRELDSAAGVHGEFSAWALAHTDVTAIGYIERGRLEIRLPPQQYPTRRERNDIAMIIAREYRARAGWEGMIYVFVLDSLDRRTGEIKLPPARGDMRTDYTVRP